MNHYTVFFKTQNVRFKLSFKSGRFFRIERQAGFLNKEQLIQLGQVIPEYEKDIAELSSRFSGRVQYEAICKKPASTYQKFVRAWLQFYAYELGIEPSFNAAEGRALKGVIKYLTKIGGSETEAYELFSTLLSNFNKLDQFHQQNFDLKYLNGNINRIIKNVQKSTSKTNASYSQDFKRKINDALRSS